MVSASVVVVHMISSDDQKLLAKVTFRILGAPDVAWGDCRPRHRVPRSEPNSQQRGRPAYCSVRPGRSPSRGEIYSQLSDSITGALR